MRIGFGYDLHRFTSGKSITLGGLNIPFDKGLKAHSDGDVLIHAVIDSLLGALALGDIGKFFPDNDKSNKDRSSRSMLQIVKKLVDKAGYKISNVDATIITEYPKMAPFIFEMRTNIANDLDLEVDCISVKATTNEKIGAIGKEEGIAVHSVCLVQKRV